MKYAIVLVLLAVNAAFGQVATPNSTPKNESQGYSKSQPAPTSGQSPCADKTASDPQTVLREARSLFIRSKALTVRAHEIENALLKKRAFAALKIILTRNEGEADLILELAHKPLSTRFYFTVVEPCGPSVVASGRVSSLFGTVDGKVADSFIKQVKKARAN